MRFWLALFVALTGIQQVSISRPAGANERQPAALEVLVECTVRHENWRTTVERFLSLSQFAPEYTRLLKNIAWNENCDDHFRGPIAFSPETFRLPLFGAWADTDPAQGKLNASKNQIVADCLVNSLEKPVRSLVESEPGSDVEDQAFSRLESHLPLCAVSENPLELSKATLRDVLTSTLALSDAAKDQREFRMNTDA